MNNNYGQMGHMGRAGWKKLLYHSSHPLFKKYSPPDNIVGPRLKEDGSIVNATMELVENNAFQNAASPEQKKFYDELLNLNPAAAEEYMLVISGAVIIWKEDIKWIRVVVSFLEEKNNLLHEEEKLLGKAGLKVSDFEKRIPKIMKTMFPGIFIDLELRGKSFREILHSIKDAEKRVENLEHYLKDYLEKLKRFKPFLFD